MSRTSLPVRLAAIVLILMSLMAFRSCTAAPSAKPAVICTGVQNVTANHGDDLDTLISDNINGSFTIRLVEEQVVILNNMANKQIAEGKKYKLFWECNDTK